MDGKARIGVGTQVNEVVARGSLAMEGDQYIAGSGCEKEPHHESLLLRIKLNERVDGLERLTRRDGGSGNANILEEAALTPHDVASS